MANDIKELRKFIHGSSNTLELKDRRGVYINVNDAIKKFGNPLDENETKTFEKFDLIYRTLCGVLFNFVPTSGHPGGSISCGRFVESLLFGVMEYDLSEPHRKDNDMLIYGAGHKAMGQYAMWALRNEIARAAGGDLLAEKQSWQMRLEDLLGFRKNPITPTPLFKKFQAKALDGHAGPNVPFVPTSTGPSGVATAAAVGVAFAALDSFHPNPPKIHCIEGEAGMSAGRVLEVLGTASTNRLYNYILHLDWNQASIDSDSPCREGTKRGEYVQWTPSELAFLNDFNVIVVPEGFDFNQVRLAQELALAMDNFQPTCIVYRTVKGWQYGIEGAKSHGGGHACCSDEYYNYLKTFENEFDVKIPRLEGEATAVNLEANFWATLEVFRKVIEQSKDLHTALALTLAEGQKSLNITRRKKRETCGNIDSIFTANVLDAGTVPEELKVEPKVGTTLRGELGKTLNYLNKKSKGAFIGAAADLYGSTNLKNINDGFPDGFYDAEKNNETRLISAGGICEDSMGAVMTGISTFGNHVGVAASYAAFIAGFEHVATRVHCIGQQLKQECEEAPYCPFIMINGHAGVKTGEDGPTHADPQCLQLLQENFVKGTLITLTPWDPAEVWPLVANGLKKRPAVLAPFVTRPKETVVDRKGLGLAPITACETGVYELLKPEEGRPVDATVVLQGSECAFGFIEALPKLREAKLNVQAYYVASAELFELLSKDEKEKVYPESAAMKAMGISGFTLPTLYRWVRSDLGREHSLYPFKAGHYLGSGKGDMVVKQAGLDGETQFNAIKAFAEVSP